MAGLVPAISIMLARQCPPKRDARDKRGHDDLGRFGGHVARRLKRCWAHNPVPISTTPIAIQNLE